MSSLGDIQNQVLELYIGMFDRAADADGLAYWVNNITANGWSIPDVARSMFDSQEVAVKYPEDLSDSDFVNEIYRNILDREADSEGLAYWVGELENNIPRHQMIVAIINGAKSPTGGADDKLLLENKTEVARHFAITLQENDVNRSVAAIANVTSDLATKDQAIDDLNLYKDSQDEDVTLIQGDTDNNIINGTATGEHIYASHGDDIINAGDGDNVVYAGDGLDSIYAGSGADQLFGRQGDDTIYAGDGNDIIEGDGGNDSLHGEAGDDIIRGEDGNDFIYGDAGNDVIEAGDGNDTIAGGEGNNTIYGGDGDDTVTNGTGSNFIDGGAGDDVIYGGSGVDRIYGGDGNDILYGLASVDTIDGLTGDDTIYAGEGNDMVSGSEGNDILFGNAGNDRLEGEEGRDIINAGAGTDVITGGSGFDTFIFEAGHSAATAPDQITDFEYDEDGFDQIQLVERGTEIINATALDVSAANTLVDAANLATTQDGSINAYISWFVFQENTYLVQDLDAGSIFDASEDIIIQLHGIHDLSTLNTNTLLFG